MQKGRINAFAGLFVFALLVGAFQNCGPLLPGKGTDTGNPARGAPESPVAMQLARILCDKISECHPSADQVACLTSVSDDVEIGSRFHQMQLQISLNQLHSAEESGQVTVDSEGSSECAAEISALTCADSAVAGSYLNGSFAGAKGLIPETGACPLIYH